MAQLSRTYQVVLILAAVLALAWFTVLRNQISNSSSSAPQTRTAQSTHSSSQGSAKASQAGSISQDEGASTRVYHGPVPGLQGLSKDINRAHQAVSSSDAQSRRLESSAGSTPTQSSTVPPSAQSATSSPTTSHSNATRSAKSTHASSQSGSAASSASHLAAGGRSSTAGAHPDRADLRAVTISKQLQQGKVVLLLFWNSKSFDGQAVHAQVLAVSHSLRRRVAADFAKASEVGAFGTVTADISVLQTPTLLVINHKGLVTTITGLTDAFSIEQAVREAR
jgi:hypothetical protein